MDMDTLLGDSDISMLVKFVEPQFVETTMEGNIYFARNKYFIELENNEINKGIADKHEGNWSLLLEEGDQIVLDSIVFPVTPNVIHTKYDLTAKIPICCFVYLSLRNDFEIVLDTNKLKLKSDVELELKKQFEGRHMILVRDMWQLIERMKKSAKAMDVHLANALVEYYDEQNDPHPLTREEYEKKPILALFYKSKFFEHQKEFRFVISKISENDVTISIGNINDIAVDLGKVEVDKEIAIGIEFLETDETQDNGDDENGGL